MRAGNHASRSMRGPIASSGTFHGSSQQSTRCGFPIDTSVMCGSTPAASHHPAAPKRMSSTGCATTRAAAATPSMRAGIRSCARIGAPIITLARATRPSEPRSHETSSTPRPVSTRSGFACAMPRSTANLATQRMPLPHISPSLPSALNMRMRTSASARLGAQTAISPSLPTATWRSLTSRAARARSTPACCLASM